MRIRKTLCMGIVWTCWYFVPLCGIESNETNLSLVHRLWELGDAHLLEHLDEFFADQVCVHNLSTQGEALTVDLATIAQWEHQRIQALPGTWEPLEVAAFEDKVVAYCKCTGIHAGELCGFPATGKPFSFFGMILFRFEQGKICEIWSAWDRLFVLEQLK